MVVQNIFSFIYRHYRLTLEAIALVFLFGSFLLGTSANEKNVSASTHNEKYFKCIDISYNDTLWSIADTYMTEEYSSTEEYIDEVKSINNLTSDKIYSGATLVIPYYAAPN